MPDLGASLPNSRVKGSMSASFKITQDTSLCWMVLENATGQIKPDSYTSLSESCCWGSPFPTPGSPWLSHTLKLGASALGIRRVHLFLNTFFPDKLLSFFSTSRITNMIFRLASNTDRKFLRGIVKCLCAARYLLDCKVGMLRNPALCWLWTTLRASLSL